MYRRKGGVRVKISVFPVVSRMGLMFLALGILSGFTPSGADAETLLLRQPDLHGDRVVFVYAGDIWTVSAAGGRACKLTSHSGMELFPVFSPDGKSIAFSAEYSGSREIWVMPSTGGEPRQLTFYPDVGRMPPRGGWDTFPIGWTPDGTKVLFRSNRTPYGKRVSRYFLANVDGTGLETPLEIPEGGPASLSADGTRLAYSIKSREFRTWKRYKAGRAQDVFIYDLKAHTIDRVTDYPGTDNFPIWVGSTIYFTSDRSTVDSTEPRRLNFFKVRPDIGEIEQVTDFGDYDCLWPHGGPGGIIFENGGALWILDPSTDQTRRLKISVLDDRPHARPRWVDATENIESADLSPNAKRAIFSARGDIFTVPVKSGEVRNLTKTPGIRERMADWSPDGSMISYLSDESGEYELILRNYHSEADPVRLMTASDAWITGYLWSPDSSHIAITDTRHRIRIIDVESHEETLVDTGQWASLGDPVWSPGGDWLAYSKTGKNTISSIWLYSLKDGTKHQATSGRYDAYDPGFDPDGLYLYFIARTKYEWEDRDFTARLYLATLRADLTSPFLAEDDDEVDSGEEKIENSKKTGDDGKNTKKEDEKISGGTSGLRIDTEGMDQRVIALPVDSGVVYDVNPIEGGLLYGRDGNLKIFTLKDQKEEVVVEKVSVFLPTWDGKKLLVRQASNWAVIDAAPGQKIAGNTLDLSNVRVLVDPKIEWPQIYRDAWRIVRDWFYDPGMHGVDWEAVRDRYAVLLPHLGHRSDLDYILGEMIGELNTGHTYVHSPDDIEEIERVDIGVLGCELEADGERYRIGKIFQSRETDVSKASPLTAPGLDIREGQYLIAIEGEDLTTRDNPYRLLVRRAGRETTLTINDKPEKEGARDVLVIPLKSEMRLRHDDWVENNRRIVDRLSGGRIGYIYVPDTSFDGFREFYQGWFEQSTKDALIIDDRYNGGGQIPSPMALDMAKPRLSYWGRRYLELSSTPRFVNEGPKVMLINGLSSSGGDAFPTYFRKLKLGPLMGATTWGGLVGYGYSPSFVDGGSLAVPSFGFVNTEGHWDVEYVGVTPDIEVFDDPTLIRLGREPMLERAVEYLLDQLEKHPPVTVEKPPGPDRS